MEAEAAKDKLPSATLSEPKERVGAKLNSVHQVKETAALGSKHPKNGIRGVVP